MAKGQMRSNREKKKPKQDKDKKQASSAYTQAYRPPSSSSTLVKKDPGP